MLLCAHEALRQHGQSPARLKAFTLSVGDGGDDAEQSGAFLRRTGLEFVAEEIAISADTVDPLAACRVIEDYKPLDVECAAAGLSLLRGIRERYPDWRWLIDGDGGDENLKDYPIEDNTALTIRSVVSNRMLYQEGWGVNAIKHSQTYSGGLGRGCVRGYAPARRYGFEVVSPFTSPGVIAVAEAIPFDRLTEGSNERLYQLKGEVLGRGVRLVLGRELPAFPKRRFQQGAMTGHTFQQLFGSHADRYRRHFLDQYVSA